VMDHERGSAGPVCPTCGAGVPTGARFRPSCGAPIVAGAPERRVVTVLFADLVDSTRDAARSLGAELTDFPPQLRISLDTAEVAGEVRQQAEAIGAHALARGLPEAAP
jgi:class 3 adenylate cyclase